MVYWPSFGRIACYSYIVATLSRPNLCKAVIGFQKCSGFRKLKAFAWLVRLKPVLLLILWNGELMKEKIKLGKKGGARRIAGELAKIRKSPIGKEVFEILENYNKTKKETDMKSAKSACDAGI